MRRLSPLRRGFTLVELLVVIGIIVLLIGILLPALSRARVQALDTSCRARLQQIFHLQTLYANEYRGNYTPVATTADTLDVRAWPMLLAPYTSIRDDATRRSIFNCPSVDSDELQSQAGDLSARTSYGLNSCIMMPTWSARQGRKLNVAELIFMGEKPVNTLDYLVTDDGWHFIYDPDNVNTMWSWQMQHSAHASYRHGGTADKHGNALMADGHVESVNRSNMLKSSGKWFKDDGTDYPVMIFYGPCCGVTPTN